MNSEKDLIDRMKFLCETINCDMVALGERAAQNEGMADLCHLTETECCQMDEEMVDISEMVDCIRREIRELKDVYHRWAREQDLNE